MPVTGYTLALSWSPEHCRSRKGGGDAFQCAGPSRFGFVLHGLWPDGPNGRWPQYCQSATLLPPAVIRGMLCVTPSADLLQHEWAKHGTCMSRDPAAYFQQGRTLFGALRFPDMDALSHRLVLKAGDIASAFAAANAGVTARSVRVRTSRQGWLQELSLCLDKGFNYVRCENSKGYAPSNARVRVWRERP
jgi:ribonuclease T2